MRTKTEVITPEWAIDKLENHNPNNRKLSENTVQSYANDMRNGRWVLNHQGIAFDTEGNLQDGQHRLWAVVFSNKSVEMQVNYDCPVIIDHGDGKAVSVMDTIDRGRFRQTGQQMQIHGIENGALTAAICRAIALLLYPAVGNSRISTTNSMFIYELWRSDIEGVIDAMSSASKKKGYICAPLVLYHHGEQEKARRFCAEICTLENMSPQARAFVKYMDVTHNKGSHDKTSRILAQVILNYHNDHPITKVQDADAGRDFLAGMYPSLTRKVHEALKPINTINIRKKLNKAKAKQNA